MSARWLLSFCAQGARFCTLRGRALKWVIIPTSGACDAILFSSGKLPPFCVSCLDWALLLCNLQTPRWPQASPRHRGVVFWQAERGFGVSGFAGFGVLGGCHAAMLEMCFLEALAQAFVNRTAKIASDSGLSKRHFVARCKGTAKREVSQGAARIWRLCVIAPNDLMPLFPPATKTESLANPRKTIMLQDSISFPACATIASNMPNGAVAAVSALASLCPCFSPPPDWHAMPT